MALPATRKGAAAEGAGQGAGRSPHPGSSAASGPRRGRALGREPSSARFPVTNLTLSSRPLANAQ